jgi:hypothetical protein
VKQQILARTAILAVALFSLAGCDSVRSALGLDRHVPDETQVVAHPALTLPPDYNLRPPGTATQVSAEHEAGSSPGQASGTAGEQALQSSAEAGAAPKEEKGFFGRLFDFLDPFSDGPAVAQPQASDASQQPAPPASEPAPAQPNSGTPAPSGK